ncbi:MAG: ABC transporter transmembrane domain-containing protein, partial [Oscillospiraceae bacterium]
MKNHNEPPQIKHPHRLTSYFRLELVTLSIVSLSGILYNIGLTASPYFEGQLAQRLYDVMNGKKSAADMMALALVYLLVILVVQGARCVKRFYVRRLANDTGRNMRRMLYNTLVHMRQTELEQESVGTIMTKAVADVDACVEGMRKFTTEIFDTGIALIAYLVMLFLYDWRLALISCAFPPIAYLMAEKLKLVVYRFNSTYKKRAGALADATLDRITNAITYRVFGRESARDTDYEECLSDYEHAAVAATIWDNTPQPIYQ